MKKRILSLMISGAIAVMGLTGCSGTGTGGAPSDAVITKDQSNAVVYDFSERDGTKTQYIKKFDQFATTWGFVGDTAGTIRQSSINTLAALKDLKAESMRFDLFMGYTGVGYNIGRNATLNGSTDAEYAQMMQVVNGLEKNDILPQLVLFACPGYAQTTGRFQDVPDPDKWAELLKNMATYFKDKGVRIGAYEIWNEPDLGNTYFDGTWEQYIDTYIAGAKALREGDPDAFIQGMSVSWIYKIVETVGAGRLRTNWEDFIKDAYEANALPDSLSWHFYGREGKLEGIKGVGGDGEDFSVYRQAMLDALTNSQAGTSLHDTEVYPLETMQQHLNEFNVYQPLADTSWKTTAVVPGMYNAIETLLAANDITRVNWATFLSEQNGGVGCSAIDTYTLQRYPAYHVNWTYGRLPVNRIAQPELGEGLGTMAAADNGRAGLIVYNSAETEKSAKVAFTGIPFEKGDVSVYLVDEDHYTYTSYNAPVLIERYKDADVNDLAATLSLKPNGMYYIEINNADGTPTDLEVANEGLRDHIVRKDYWYPQRGDNTVYSDLWENNLTAYLGMNGNEEGKSAVCVTLDDMKNKEIKLDYETWGELASGDEAALGVKIDFRTGTGYAKSVWLPLGGFEKDLVLPFGGKGECTETVALGELGTGTKAVALDEIAPDGWDGRITVSFVIANAGTDATARINLHL